MSLPKRILVIRLSAMGDLAMCVPVLLALHRSYPEVEVVALSRKRFLPILEQLPNVVPVAAQLDGTHKGILGLLRLSRELKKYQLDAIADLHDVLRSKVLKTMLPGLKKATIDKGRDLKRRLVNDPTFFEPLTNTVDRYATVFNQLGYSLQLEASCVLPQPELKLDARELFNCKAKRIIGFAPFAAHVTKSLSIERAAQHLQAMVNRNDAHIILFGGGAQEKKWLEKLAKPYTLVDSMAGKFSFKEELALIAQLDAMIAMDSGNGHLAAMYGVPVITFWGNTHPYAGFAPYGQSEQLQLNVNKQDYPLIPTSIFGKKMIPGYENAVDSIQTTALQQALDRLFKN